MQLFNIEDFKKLNEFGKDNDLVISLYCPVSRSSNENYQEDKLQFKNLLKSAENDLKEKYGRDSKQAAEALENAYQLIDDQEFWQHNADVLAVYLSGGEMEIAKLPVPLEKPLFFIGRETYLIPLLPALNNDGHYYLLLLNLTNVHLFECTRHTIQEITLGKNVPVSFTEEEEATDKQDQLHAGGDVGTAGAMYHGQGEGSDEKKKVTILQYFHRLSNEIDPMLHKKPLPLVLAGVDYLIPIYKEATNYKPILEARVSGSFTEADALELSARSWEAAEAFFSEEKKQRKELYSGKEAKNLAEASDTTAIFLAAFTGNVDTLFLNPTHEHIWGMYHPDTHTITYDEGYNGSNHCLVDAASKQSLLSGAKVYWVNDDETPLHAPLSAIFRYKPQYSN